MQTLSTTTRAVRAAWVLGFAVLASSAYADEGFYQQRNLVSDGYIATEQPADPNLVNAWGLAFNPFAVAWVADADKGVSTLYDGDGHVQGLVVAIPTPTTPTGGSPTGIVFNGSGVFTVSKLINNVTVTGPSRFLFATEQGVIAGWAPNVDGTHALVAVDNSIKTGARYKGLALSGGGNGLRLYAADFFNGRVDVFNSSFGDAGLPAGSFTDPRLPPGYAPFGIQAIGGDIYVTYAKQDAEHEDEVAGPGLGFVDVYDPNGHLIRRIASRGNLNAPWGLALAPASFGRFSNALLVGNFGDGRINAFDLHGVPLGQLRGANHQPITIDGLWGLQFGNGQLDQPIDTLFFTAGPNDEHDGLFGRLDAVGGGDDDD
jgi:uncharacterized protein (TIGR03118 family)